MFSPSAKPSSDKTTDNVPLFTHNRVSRPQYFKALFRSNEIPSESDIVDCHTNKLFVSVLPSSTDCIPGEGEYGRLTVSLKRKDLVPWSSLGITPILRLVSTCVKLYYWNLGQVTKTIVMSIKSS